MRHIFIKKQVSSSLGSQHQDAVLPFVISDLEQTIAPQNCSLPTRNNCPCDLCMQKKVLNNQVPDSNIFRSSSRQSSQWLKKLLDALCLSGAKTLKIYLPDILFAEGDSLQIFQTNRKDGRLLKFSGTTPLKSLFPTVLRLRRQYKSILEQNFNQKMFDKIDPQFMHIKYFDRLVPSHFHDGMQSSFLHQNKFQFKRYILHKNIKYEIQQIQEHKMNQKQPFCLVKYKDGNCQLFNQIQFQVYSLTNPAKIQQDLKFVQSYIKYKLQTEAIYYSEYTLSPHTIDKTMDLRAERQIMILIGGITKFDQGYSDIDTLQQLSYQMMLGKPLQYVQFMTYKMVHYLSMTSRIYIDHIKIKWIMNDIGNIYLQQIMEFQMSQIPRRFIKFRLPPKDQALDFYHESHNFVQMYKQLKRRKAVNTLIIRKNLQNKSYQQILQIMNPCTQKDQSKLGSNSIQDNQLFAKSHTKKTSQLNKTIDITNPKTTYNNLPGQNTDRKDRYSSSNTYEQHLRMNPHAKKRMSESLGLDRWRNIGEEDKKIKASNKINSCFTIKKPLQINKTTRQSNNTRKSWKFQNKKENSNHPSILLINTERLIDRENNQSQRKKNSQSASSKLRHKISIDFQ